MKLTPSDIYNDDNELSQFARAIALPVRVFIIRRMVENGFSIKKDELHSPDFNTQTINKHVLELKALGFIKVTRIRGDITYWIEENWFGQISGKFSALFNSIDHFNPRNADQDIRPDKNLTPETGAKKIPGLQSFGAFIKSHRSQLNISQDDLARYIKIDRAQLSRIECGKSKLSADKLPVLAKALYLNLEALTKEYYSYRVAELLEESGYKDLILNSAKEKLEHSGF